MGDVNETLQDLMTRRLREMGLAEGGDRPMSLRKAYQRVPEGEDSRPMASYETFRQIHTGVHSGNITDYTAQALAHVLRVHPDDVYEAAGQRRRPGPFVLPDRAAQLDDRERKVVLGVIDAIIEAGRRGQADPTQADIFEVTLGAGYPEERQTDLRVIPDAARDIGKRSRGQQMRDDIDSAGEPPVDDPDDMEPR